MRGNAQTGERINGRAALTHRWGENVIPSNKTVFTKSTEASVFLVNCFTSFRAGVGDSFPQGAARETRTDVEGRSDKRISDKNP